MSLPASPHSPLGFLSRHPPFSGLTNRPGEMIVGAIIPFAGSINYKTFILDRKNNNANKIIDFSPTAKNNSGWIVCSGSQVEATVFPRLFNALGYLYGKGDQPGRFFVPDYRGYFLRGMDTSDDSHNLDPGLKERKIYGTSEQRKINGSTGTATGAGSVQDCMVQMHEHHYDNYPAVAFVPPPDPPPPPNVSVVMEQKNNITYDLLIDNKKISDDDAKETRPVNIYINFLIYAGLPGKPKAGQ